MKKLKNSLKNLYKCLLFSFILVNSACLSQTFEWVYQHINNNWNANICIKSAADDLGNIYSAGKKFSNGNFDIMVFKINSSGNLLWQTSFNGILNLDDEALDICYMNGYIYVTGFVRDTINYYKDIILIKYDINGNLIWNKSYNGPGNFDDIGKKVLSDGQGNIYVGGTSYGIGTQEDYVLIKYNSVGTRLWVQRYNGSANAYDDFRDMKLDAFGNIYITGSSYGTSTGIDYCTIKYSSLLGNILWESRYFNNSGSFNPDEAAALALDENNDVYVTGYSNETGQAYDIFTQKYSSSTGAQLWSKRYNGSANSWDIPTGITADKYNNIYICGTTYVTGEPYKRSVFIKYNSIGSDIFIKTHSYSNQFDETPKGIVSDSAGNIFATIETFDNLNNYLILNVKLNPSNGNYSWSHIYSPNTQNFSNSIISDNLMNIYVSGQTGSRSFVIKYSQQIVGIINQNNIAEYFELNQNYPNPFNPVTNISFSVAKSQIVKVIVYDINGKLVEVLLDKFINSGNYNIMFDGSKLSSGVYFYKIQTEGFSDTKKMILAK